MITSESESEEEEDIKSIQVSIYLAYGPKKVYDRVCSLNQLID